MLTSAELDRAYTGEKQTHFTKGEGDLKFLCGRSNGLWMCDVDGGNIPDADVALWTLDNAEGLAPVGGKCCLECLTHVADIAGV